MSNVYLRAESEYKDALNTRITVNIAFVGFTILVWDHIITLQDEVRYIWRGRKSFRMLFLFVGRLTSPTNQLQHQVIYLFFLNRYFTPLSFIGNFIGTVQAHLKGKCNIKCCFAAYFSDWSSESCAHFVRFEGATVAIAVLVSGLMMLIRIRALYNDKPKVVWLVGTALLVEAGVFAWLLTYGEAVQHGPEIHGHAILACSMVFDMRLRFLPSLSAWVPLLYDTVVILLTLFRCVEIVKQRTASHIVRTLLKDGLMYYSAIFAVNLVLAVMIMSTPAGVKNIAAQLEQFLTVAMMSRITLSLRREGQYDPGSDPEHYDSYLYPRSPGGGHITFSDNDREYHSLGRRELGRRELESLSRTSIRRVTDVSFEEAMGRPAPDVSARKGGFSFDIRSADVRSWATSAMEHGDPHAPERAVLSVRDAYELRTLRPSRVARQ
ncbi:hypothetical protein DFH11DRAFT_1886334 [Phellopilus nigrolimitatus]|nr:hypothetical protein DFH11DRAFT_1886334 [Phellopilus nigrolimitatus]